MFCNTRANQNVTGTDEPYPSSRKKTLKNIWNINLCVVYLYKQNNKNMETNIWKIEGRHFNPQETMKVLAHNPMIFWSWGVSGKIKTIGTDEDGYVKGMMLKVNGRKWKQNVLITLNFADWYEVYLVNRDLEIVEKVGGDICFEDLVETIDNRIETD